MQVIENEQPLIDYTISSSIMAIFDSIKEKLKRGQANLSEKFKPLINVQGDIKEKTSEITKVFTQTPPLQNWWNDIADLEKSVTNFRIEKKEDLIHDELLKALVCISSFVYDESQIQEPPKGWIQIDRFRGEAGLKACVCRNAENQYVIAFAGTQSRRDAGENVSQLIGQSKQYENALLYAKKIMEQYDTEDVIFTGHSQGGGEAAYCAYSLGLKAVTFNPAGLSASTKIKLPPQNAECASIDAYIYMTDLLNIAQMISKLYAIARELRIGPDGRVHYLGHFPSKLKMSQFHGMEGFLDYFEIKR